MDGTIIYGKDFDDCVGRLGGYRAIDLASEAVVDGLRRDPFGFHKFESDDFSFRYAIAERLGHIAPLSVIFEINADRTVTLVHAEEVHSYRSANPPLANENKSGTFTSVAGRMRPCQKDTTP